MKQTFASEDDQFGNPLADYRHLDLPIIESRIDWITCTCDLEHHPDVLRRHGELRCEDFEQAGERIQPWRFQGYRGLQCGPWRVGFGKLGTIAAVSGVEAEKEALLLARYATHWSRVDYCVTVLDQNDLINPVNDYWGAWPPIDLPANRYTACSRIQGYLGGSSVYFGKRASAQYVRVYDKTAESEGEYPKRSWRFEVELKRHKSEGEQLRWSHGYAPLSYPQNLLAECIGSYALPVPWQTGRAVQTAIEIKPRRGIDRTIRWLATQVRPSVEWAAEQVGEEAVLEALGLGSSTSEGRK